MTVSMAKLTESTQHTAPDSGAGEQAAPVKFVASTNGAEDAHPSALPDGELARNGAHPSADAPDEAVEAASADSSRPAPPEPLQRHAVKIRGRAGGVVVEIGEGDWEPLLELLRERLDAAEGFFRGGRVMLALGEREVEVEHLRQVGDLLDEHAMRLAIVAGTGEVTQESAAVLGVAVTAGSEDGEFPLAQAAPVAPTKPVEVPPPQPATPPVAPVEALPPPPQHYVYRGSLRSGQILRKTESIVIIGDVNPGAQVISGGDIMVWGRLRGVAHAGADGNRRAVVAAIDFVPTQLRIAKVTTIPPEQKRGRGFFFWRKQAARRPEIARIVDGKIIVEPWDETRSYGTSVLRK